MSRDSEYLTFILGREEFGVDILCVQEIMVWSPVTEIPNSPSYLKGVINLRGVIVPIVDLRERFGCAEANYSASTVVLVLKLNAQGREHVVGFVVDAVSEVYKFDDGDIKASPHFGTQVESQFISGMAAVDDKLILILNTDSLFDYEQLYSATSRIIRKQASGQGEAC